jgi:hypothetical protein
MPFVINEVTGPFPSVKEQKESERLQVFVDATLAEQATTVSDQANSIAMLSTILPDCVLNTAGFAIGSDKTKVAHGAVNYVLNGVYHTLPANAVGLALGTTTTAQNMYGAWVFDVDENEEVTVWPAADNTTGYASANVAIYACPDIVPGTLRIGSFTAASSAAAGFIAGTTEIDAAAVTEVYRNVAALKTGILSSPMMGEDDGTANVAEIFSPFSYMINGVTYRKALAAGIALTNGVTTKAVKFGAYRFYIDSAGTVTMQSAPSTLVDGSQKLNYSTEAEALSALNRMPPIGATCAISTLVITTASADFVPASTDIGAADVTDTWYDGTYLMEKIFA